MQCHDGAWRGLTHPSQGWHNLNLLYSYNILKYIKCPKSHSVFMTIINSDYCDIQLLFLSVLFLLAVERPLMQFGSGSVTRQAPLLKPLALSFQTST